MRAAAGPLDATRAQIEAAGGECFTVPADVREEDDVARVVDSALDRFGHVDVLVNNAGGQFEAAAEDISVNGWRAVHRLSVEAAWSMTREVATRSMIPGDGGLIVLIGFSPLRGMARFAHGAAARAALRNLASSLALEWSRHGIRTVCVAPGLDPHRGAEQVRRGRGVGVGEGSPAGAARHRRRWRA